MHVFFGFPAGRFNRFDFTMTFYGKAGDRLSGLGNAVHNDIGPFRLNPNDHNSRYVGIGSGADEGAKK